MRAALVLPCFFLFAYPTWTRAGPPETPLVTDRGRYEVEFHADRVEVKIPLTYTNLSGQVRFLPGCQGPPAGVLEKREGNQWVVAFAPIAQACLSHPVPEVIPRGTFSFEFQVCGSRGSFEPEFKPSAVKGTYRVRWKVFKTMAWTSPDGTSLKPDTYSSTVYSNEFSLVSWHP